MTVGQSTSGSDVLIASEVERSQKVVKSYQATTKGQRAKYNHQLRLGLEALFPDERHPIQLIFDHVGLTFTIASDSNIAKEGPKFSQEAHEVLKPVMVNIPT